MVVVGADVILIWAVCTVVTALLWTSKGGTPLGGIVMGALLGVLGILVALLVQPTVTTRRCPHCREKMQRSASVCPHCQRESPSWTKHQGRWWLRQDDGWLVYHEGEGWRKHGEPIAGTTVAPGERVRVLVGLGVLMALIVGVSLWVTREDRADSATEVTARVSRFHAVDDSTVSVFLAISSTSAGTISCTLEAFADSTLMGSETTDIEVEAGLTPKSVTMSVDGTAERVTSVDAEC